MTLPVAHDEYADVEVAVTEKLPDGGIRVQTWTICARHLPDLRAHLGMPHGDFVHTAEAIADAKRGVWIVPDPSDDADLSVTRTTDGDQP